MVRLALCLCLSVLAAGTQARGPPDTPASAPLAFKTCKSLSSIQRCKVKAVEVLGCQDDVSSWNHVPKDNYVDYRRGSRNHCEVRKKTQLDFNITLHTGFSADQVSSQFSVVDYPNSDCTPLARRLGQCSGGRRDSACTPGSSAEHCLFREHVRDACRFANCTLGPQGLLTLGDYLKVNPDTDTLVDKRVYKVQWRLWSKSNKKDNCCFTFWLKYY